MQTNKQTKTKELCSVCTLHSNMQHIITTLSPEKLSLCEHAIVLYILQEINNQNVDYIKTLSDRITKK